MKTRFSNHVRFLSLVCLAALALAPRASAQTPPVLGLQLYAGLSITGAVGTVYSVEYVTDLSETNNPSARRCLEFLQLPASPHLWADKSTPATGQRFYRAVQMQASTNMVFIPPGTFRMGSPANEVDRWGGESPQTPPVAEPPHRHVSRSGNTSATAGVLLPGPGGLAGEGLYFESAIAWRVSAITRSAYCESRL